MRLHFIFAFFLTFFFSSLFFFRLKFRFFHNNFRYQIVQTSNFVRQMSEEQRRKREREKERRKKNEWRRKHFWNKMSSPTLEKNLSKWNKSAVKKIGQIECMRCAIEVKWSTLRAYAISTYAAYYWKISLRRKYFARKWISLRKLMIFIDYIFESFVVAGSQQHSTLALIAFVEVDLLFLSIVWSFVYNLWYE